MNTSQSTKKIVTMGVMAALSVLLVALIRIPFPGATFLVYDPADVPILIGTFIFGPWNGLLLTTAVSLVQGFAMSTDGIVGIVMHILATGSLVLVAGSIHKRKEDYKSAIIGIITGALVMTVTMVFWNLIVTPLYYGSR
jgi:riboflavin transporter FmnP